MTEAEKQDYILKRDVILETLEKLFDYWEMARPLYKLVNSIDVTAEIIDEIINIIDISYKKLYDDEQKEKLELAMSNLKLIKTREIKEKTNENEEVNVMVNDLLF
ncbi:MAG: hypothetical protein ACD_3C00041G0002 [uncultured bacterium (gcode 4)]|uniref:Uncharacterized protein n=1 Tax=uncultured bacterium (gcode 4) TaxID=1234023 RepID=K2G2U7_9BACT|nr:MAG: hypothetical protein ACD_3C00041G0002 [uncultured bacterium (gcode 4)]